MSRRWVALAALCLSACAPPLMKLPAGPATRAADGAEAVADATAACSRVTSLTAEIGVSGSVAGQRLRGRMLAGISRSPEPGVTSIRLEAAAPFGAPLFIFVARGADASLLLPRDDRILEHGTPADVLEAVAGVPLSPEDLRSVLTGCASAPHSADASQPSADWRIVPDATGHLYLRRERSTAPWRLVAAVRPGNGGGWRADYGEFEQGLPRAVRLTGLAPRRFDLRLALSQVETNVELGAEAFRLRIPPGARPIGLSELRDSGPLGRASR